MLEIKINRIKATTYIGVYDWEQENKQDIYVTIHLQLNSSKSIDSDNLNDSIDYEDIQNTIKNHIENNRFLLIEKIAGDSHKLLLKNKLVKSATVIVEKPNALKHSESVSVQYSSNCKSN